MLKFGRKQEVCYYCGFSTDELLVGGQRVGATLARLIHAIFLVVLPVITVS